MVRLHVWATIATRSQSRLPYPRSLWTRSPARPRSAAARAADAARAPVGAARRGGTARRWPARPRGARPRGARRGEALAALAEGDRTLRLGCSGIGDYARERLGIAGRTAQAMAHLARELRAWPILLEAVRRGELSARKAQAVLLLARGEAEEEWVARARAETVRALVLVAVLMAFARGLGGARYVPKPAPRNLPAEVERKK